MVRLQDSTKRFLMKGLVVAGFVWIFSFLTAQYPYNFRFIFNEEEVILSLGTFSPPEKYELKSVRKGGQGENILIIYANQENGQKLFISLLREHLGDDLNQVQILNRTKVERTFQYAGFENKTVRSFRFEYLLPFYFRKDDLSGMGDEAIIKGINVESQDKFETSAAEILYVAGEFTKIGLFKEPKGRWHYPTPVFNFITLHEGAIAFIKSKKSGRVLVTVSVNSLEQFQKEEFRAFLKSFEPA